jgi:tetratricopeptide (TPR) repeat protein
MPDDLSELARTATNLAATYLNAEQLEPAEAMLMQAMNWHRSSGQTQSENAAVTLANLASLHRSKGDLVSALSLQEEALSIKLATGQEFDAEACTMACNLALLYTAKGRFTEARNMAQAAMDARLRLFGSMHLDVALSMAVMSEICLYEGDTKGIELNLRQALEMLRKISPHGSSFIADFACKLATLRSAQGFKSEAEELYDESLESYQQFFEEGHRGQVYVLACQRELRLERHGLETSLSTVNEQIAKVDTTSEEEIFSHELDAPPILGYGQIAHYSVVVNVNFK